LHIEFTGLLCRTRVFVFPYKNLTWNRPLCFFLPPPFPIAVLPDILPRRVIPTAHVCHQIVFPFSPSGSPGLMHLPFFPFLFIVRRYLSLSVFYDSHPGWFRIPYLPHRRFTPLCDFNVESERRASHLVSSSAVLYIPARLGLRPCAVADLDWFRVR